MMKIGVFTINLRKWDLWLEIDFSCRCLRLRSFYSWQQLIEMVEFSILCHVHCTLKIDEKSQQCLVKFLWEFKFDRLQFRYFNIFQESRAIYWKLKAKEASFKLENMKSSGHSHEPRRFSRFSRDNQQWFLVGFLTIIPLPSTIQ